MKAVARGLISEKVAVETVIITNYGLIIVYVMCVITHMYVSTIILCELTVDVVLLANGR